MLITDTPGVSEEALKHFDVSEFPHQHGLNWTTTIALVALHIGAIAALFCFSWKNLLVTVFLYWLAIGLGISMGYHRLHTHRGYKCPVWLEYFLAVCGTLTLEGGPLFWVAVHRVHHQKSDQKGDPHSPREGFFWAHMGWIVFGEGNHNNTQLMGKYAPDLAKHKFYRELNNWHWVPLVMLSAILYLIGGLPMVLWGSCLRVVVGLHSTWLVNSATHLWGRRRFATRDDSRNNWWVALLTFGEGWHNNHHAHPVSIRHGLAWYEIDHSWILVNIWQKMGLAWDLKYVDTEGNVEGVRKAA
jgi:fatty-acid desaturase